MLKDIEAEPAFRLSHRRRWRRRGERQGQSRADGGLPGNAGDDPDDPDAAAAGLLADVHGIPDRAAGLIASSLHCSFSRLRSVSSRFSVSRAQRNDHAQLGDPGRPDSKRDGERHRPWNAVLERCGPPHPTGHAHCGGHVLAMIPSREASSGADGDRDHGRSHRRHGAHDLLRAGAVCGVVQGGTLGCAEPGRCARSRSLKAAWRVVPGNEREADGGLAPLRADRGPGAWVLHGFITPLLSACVVAIASWPLYRRFAAHMPRRVTAKHDRVDLHVRGDRIRAGAAGLRTRARWRSKARPYCGRSRSSTRRDSRFPPGSSTSGRGCPARRPLAEPACRSRWPF